MPDEIPRFSALVAMGGPHQRQRHPDGTDCAQGFIAHLEGRYPVKIETHVRDDGHTVAMTDYQGRPFALERNGRYVFALPGGAEYETAMIQPIPRRPGRPPNL